MNIKETEQKIKKQELSWHEWRSKLDRRLNRGWHFASMNAPMLCVTKEATLLTKTLAEGLDILFTMSNLETRRGRLLAEKDVADDQNCDAEDDE